MSNGLKKGDPCPACGAAIDAITTRRRGNRYYVYAVHKVGKSRYECYLGPAEGYVHADLFNPIGLKGAIDNDRFNEYLARLLYYVDNISFDKGLEILDRVLELLMEKADKEERERLMETLKAWIERLKS
mgnify:CR=1 FL=1